MRWARFAEVGRIDAIKTFAVEASETALCCIVIMSPGLVNDRVRSRKITALHRYNWGKCKTKNRFVFFEAV